MKLHLVFSMIRRKKGRFAAVLVIVSILTFSLLTGCVILISLHNGIECLKERMGADLMVVPLGYEASAEDILIKGEPSYFYLENGIYEDIINADIKGIEQITEQFYLTSSNQGCCDIPVQFIGIDEESDFTISPWIRENYQSTEQLLENGQLIVGSDIDIPENNIIRFFDREFVVSAQLEETGTGLDQAVFANRDTIIVLYQAAKEKGFTFPETLDPSDGVSSILIRVEEGVDTADVAHEIRTKYDGLQVIETSGMTSSISSGLSGFIILLFLLMALLLVLTLIILKVTFQLSILERKKDYDLMGQVGATPAQIRSLIFTETGLISLAGSFIGVLMAGLILFPFKAYISSVISIPFLYPSKLVAIGLAVIIFGIGTAAGPVCGEFASRRILQNESN